MRYRHQHLSYYRFMRGFWLTVLFLLSFACAGSPTPQKKSNSVSNYAHTQRKPEPRIPTRRKQSDPYEVYGKRYYPLSSSAGFVQRGEASWYGHEFHGRPTANGEQYNMYSRTAAHKTLPFNTYVKVTNLKNGKQTVVRINDRGPFVGGRTFDLGPGTAQALGFGGVGIVKYRILGR